MEYYLKIAEMKIAKSPDTLKTVVGSCIALCLWDRRTSSGGMVHIMMPKSNGNKAEQKSKYADTAVETLLNEMISKGSKQETIIAKIAGGASMFDHKNDKTEDEHIGEKNSRIVKKMLSKLNIPLRSEDTGGTAGRRVVFNPLTGNIASDVIEKNIIKESTAGKGKVLEKIDG